MMIVLSENFKKFLFVTVILWFSVNWISAQAVKTVVVDAGHGGKDSGTLARSSRHVHEKHIALNIALKLGKMIEGKVPGVKVIYTRKKDKYLTLNQRAKIANKANADLFISVHVDAVGTSTVKGASVYVLGLHRTEDNLKVAMRENAVMTQEDDYQTKYQGFNPNDPESYIIFSLMQNQHLDNSLMMASMVNTSLKATTQRKTKGVKQAGFYVLREVGMPSVLIETGYITNTSDANFLCSAQGQKKTAEAIFDAFVQYKNYIENNTSNLKTDVASEKIQSAENKDVYFTVQLMAAVKKVSPNSKQLKGLTPILEHQDGKTYRYTYGRTQDYQEAKRLLKIARAKIKDVFLVGYSGGKRVTARQAQDILRRK